MHLFIFGLGYSAEVIARSARSQGFSVSGTTRAQAKAEQLRKHGITIYPLENSFKLPHEVTHILSSIPPQEAGDMVLPYLSDNSWLGYLSTTGVYGDWQGAWVDETSKLKPNNERLRRRVAAEKEWLKRGGHVFRLAGIYGPGRSVLEDIKEGTARRIDKLGQVFSRIHVEDIAQTVVASMLKPNPGNAYNVCDDEPAPAHEVVAYGCELLSVSPPPMIPVEEANLSPMGQEFYSASRRVRNDKIKAELGVKLHYPTYREGLAQCLQSIQAE